MSNELTLKDLKANPLITSISENASYYGVAATVVDHKVAQNKADSGYYIVAGLGKFPEYNSPKEIENDQLRNIHLFHPKQFAMQLTPDNIQFAIEELYNYCQRAELIECLYNEYDCEIPDVIRTEELINLYKFNKGWNNEEYDIYLRRSFKNELDAFFKEEKKAERNPSAKKWKEYYRSDFYDEKKSKMQTTFDLTFKEKEQVIPYKLLRSCCDDVTRVELTEAEYQKLLEVLKKYPKINISADEKVVIDHGKLKVKDPKDDPFAGQQDYFEYRDIYFKAVDESVIMGEIYKMRWNEHGAVHRATLVGDVVAKNVSYNNIHNFVSLAKTNDLKFAIDIKGEFKKPTTDFVPILFKRDQLHKYNAIMDRINTDKVNYHGIDVANLPFLSCNLQAAEEKQANMLKIPYITSTKDTIEL